MIRSGAERSVTGSGAYRKLQPSSNLPTYAVAHLLNVTMGPQIVEYLQRIDSTLEPFAGRLLVHGGKAEVLEGVWPGHVSSPTASEPAHGTNRPPTRRSRRCAGTTPRAMSFSTIGYLNSIGRRTYWPGSGSRLCPEHHRWMELDDLFRGRQSERENQGALGRTLEPAGLA